MREGRGTSYVCGPECSSANDASRWPREHFVVRPGTTYPAEKRAFASWRQAQLFADLYGTGKTPYGCSYCGRIHLGTAQGAGGDRSDGTNRGGDGDAQASQA